MPRLLFLCACMLCLSACERRDAPGGGEHVAARPQQPPTTRPAVEPTQPATPLRLDPQALVALSSTSAPALGPYALIRDEAALSRIWPRTAGTPPVVDFRTTNLLALRVYPGVSSDSAAPRVLVRKGLTFVMLRRGAGPTAYAAGSQVQFYAIPVAEGPVRTVAYEADAALSR